MRTDTSLTPLSQIETELLAVTAIDTQTATGHDVKPEPVLLTSAVCTAVRPTNAEGSQHWLPA